MSDPFHEVAEFIREHRNPAVIFDLDSTLFCVSPRTQAILRQLADEPAFSGAHPELAGALREMEVLPTDWGIRQAMERRELAPTLEQLLLVRDYWKTHFFANDFLAHDVIYPSANEYVRHLHALGAQILYLTGRNDGLMREGTVRELKRWGFPFYADSQLYMKPSDLETDEGFKAKKLQELIAVHPQICFFENEPIIIQEVRAKLPQIKIIFVNTVHAGRAEPPTDLPQIGMSFTSGLPPTSA